MHAADKVRIVENRRQNHLAPVALHLGIPFEGVGQIGRLGRDAAVKLHEVLQFALQLAVLLAFGRIDLLDARAEIGDILFERFQQQVERFAVRLLEMARLFAQNIVGEVAELHAQQLLGLLPLGFALPDLAFQRLGCRFGFGARFDQRADLGFGPLASDMSKTAAPRTAACRSATSHAVAASAAAVFARNHDTTAAMQPPTAAAAIRINNVSIRRQMYEIGCVPASVRPRRN